MPNCPFCSTSIEIEQESFESFLILCRSGMCENFYLEKGLSGKTPEIAMQQFQNFLKELELGADMWGSKIRDGVAED